MLGDDDEDGDLFGLERQASEAENRGPRVSIPTVNDPSSSLPDPSSVDPKIQQSFLSAVLYANVAVFGVALGLMLIGFRGQVQWGGLSLVVGVLAGVRVYQTYRDFEQWRAERDEEEDDPSSVDDDESTVTDDARDHADDSNMDADAPTTADRD